MTKKETEKMYNEMKTVEYKLISAMVKNGKATLNKEEKDSILSALPEGYRKAVLINATASFKERRQIERINAFISENITIRVPSSTAYAKLKPVIYDITGKYYLALDGMNIPAIALISVNKEGHLVSKLVVKGQSVKNQLSTSYGARQLKEWEVSKVSTGLASSINDMLYSFTLDSLLKAMIATGKVTLRDARNVNEEMASYWKLDFETIKETAKIIRAKNTAKKATKIA